LSEFFDGLMVRSGQSMTAGCACDGAILRSHASRSIRRAQKWAIHLPMEEPYSTSPKLEGWKVSSPPAHESSLDPGTKQDFRSFWGP